MSTVATPVKTEPSKGATSEVKKGSENHKVAAKHHEEAAKHHHEAARHHDEGNHEKAAQHTVIANGHSTLAQEAQKADSTHHAEPAKK
jgi:hypothetical protein